MNEFAPPRQLNRYVASQNKRMKTLCQTAVLFAAALILPQIAQAQEAYLRPRIKRSIAVHKPTWRLQRSFYLPDTALGARFMGFRWKLGKSAVGAELYFHDDRNSAAKRFIDLAEPTEALPLERIQSKPVRLGDENYLLRVNDNDRGYSLVFRKGKIVVQLWARTLLLLHKFGSYKIGRAHV